MSLRDEREAQRRRWQPGRADSWIDRLMREAEERGDFDDLAGRGRPLENLAEVHDPAWWAKNFVQREDVSVVPPAIEIKRSAERTLEKLPGFRREVDARAALEKLNDEIRQVNRLAAAGPPTSLAPLDVEAQLEGWRAARAEIDARHRARNADEEKKR